MRYADAQSQQRGMDDHEVADLLAGPERSILDPDPATQAWEQRRREWAHERDKERSEWERDPIGYERTNDWDNTGDVGRHPDIEWVPTADLKKFIEYDRRPGMEHDTGSPERYQALTDHIRENGFRNPVIIDYHEDKSVAHMSEGNHRTHIALENGIPAMPVRVYRSRRDSATAIPVTLHPQPEWADHLPVGHPSREPSGYRVPDSMKPSHIGLPTVPAPTWQRMAMRRHAATTMYHVAPRYLRDKIMREGLTGHLENTTEEHTPWDRNYGQPAANYLFDHPNFAQQYAAVLAQKANGDKYPGDDPDRFMDHDLYVNRDPADEHANAYVKKNPPEDFDWDDDEAVDDWENDDDNYETYDHNTHADMLPPHLQGYDVWRAMLHGDQHLAPDPENMLREKAWRAERGEQFEHADPEQVKKYRDDPDDTTWPRWMTMNHVHPQQLSLHEHIPAWKINDMYAMNRMDEGGEFEKPAATDLIDPAYYKPKGPTPYDSMPPMPVEAPLVHSKSLRASNRVEDTWEAW